MKNLFKKSIIQSVLISTFAFTCLGANAQTATGETIKIGFSTELTGPWTFFGTSCAAGLKFAVDEINSKGGVLKRPLEFIVQDNQTNPTQALASVRNFDVNDKVLAISGTTNSDVSLAMYGYAEQNKVPFLIPVAAFPQLTKPGTKYSFRIEPDAVGWGYSMAKFIEQRKPGATVALMYSDAALMRAIFAGFKYQAEKSKLKVVTDIVFPQGSSDATVQAAQVKAANPDFVIVSGAGAFDAVLNNQILDLGIKPEQIIQPWQFGDEFQKITCLWLKNLPPLAPTKIVGKGEFVTFESGKRMSKWYSNAKGKNRSKTFPGIANAMAEQWGKF